MSIYSKLANAKRASYKHCIVVIDKSNKGKQMLKDLQRAPQPISGFFNTPGIQFWQKNNELNLLARGWSFDIPSGQTAIAGSAEALAQDGLPALVKRFGTKTGIFVIIATSLVRESFIDRAINDLLKANEALSVIPELEDAVIHNLSSIGANIGKTSRKQ